MKYEFWGNKKLGLINNPSFKIQYSTLINNNLQ